MKILIVSTYDKLGGAARGAYSIHQALVNKGIDSKMLVRRKVSDDPNVISTESNFLKLRYKFIQKFEAFRVAKYPNKSKTKFSATLNTSLDLSREINRMNPDIVHLQWIADGFLKFEDLKKIKAPIIWTIRDMLPFTGGCHYTEECERFLSECGLCKVLGSDSEKDLSNKTFLIRKKALLKVSNLTVVGISQWITKEAARSVLLKKFESYYIPNIINTKTFSEREEKESRKKLNLPIDKKLLLFGAIGAKSDPRKGYDYFLKGLKAINTENIAVVTFGGKNVNIEKIDNITFYNFGFIDDDNILIDLYNSCKLMVVPSLQEAYGKTAGESMACGTPVVAFNVGGLSDIIDHKINGYLAEPYNAKDLGTGIQWVLNCEDQESLQIQSRNKILREFSSEKVIGQYIDLYKKLTTKSRRGLV